MPGQFVSPSKVGSLVAQARRSSAPWLLLDEYDVSIGYNEHPFLVRHRLADHPRFAFDALAALCRRLPAEQVPYRFGVVPTDAEVDTSRQRFRGQLTLDDALAHLEDKQAHVAIYNAETDPEYQPVIEGLLGEIAAQTEKVEPGLNWYSTHIFITAQDSVTPYHMDREMNFLLQIRGNKTVKLWDPRDPEIMTPAQKDQLLAQRGEPRPFYKPSFDRKAMTFELGPGLGVHHPFIAPHLVKTGKELAISLAITFRTQRSDIWTDAHRFNHRLRSRLGVAPGVVRSADVVDETKAGIVRLTRQARRLLRTGNHPAVKP